MHKIITTKSTKSTPVYKFASLEKFQEAFRERIGGCFIIHPKSLQTNGIILKIPPYMTSAFSHSASYSIWPFVKIYTK